MKRSQLTILTFLLGLALTSKAEWSHYTERKGMTIFVSQQNSSNPKCKGLKEASEQKFSLGKWRYVRELCYSLNAKGDPVFSDPSSINPFSNFTLKSETFTYIPTEAEKAAAANRESMNRAIETYKRNAAERQRQIQNMHQQDGITHMIINGDPVLCIRAGPFLDCD